MLLVDKPIAAKIVELIGNEALAEGTHLPAQWLADRLRVSRSPVNEALGVLHEKGILRREPNRGYFVARPVKKSPEALAHRLGLAADDTLASIYFKIAEDCLKGKLAPEFTESALRQRYDLTLAQVQALLSRMAHEGWAEKKPGYGWALSPVLTTPESLLQSYRLRLAIEPAALIEPGYRMEPDVLERCRATEIHLLAGGIDTDSPDQLHERGVRFHEAVVEGSGNPFFIDAIRRVNRVRRLLAYRAMKDRKRYKQHCRQHLEVLNLIEQGRNEEAAEMMREHLQTTLRNYAKITDILKS
jgi:DNA-binding GntR family transcriptional regulator